MPFRGYAGDARATVGARVIEPDAALEGDPDSLRYRLKAGYRRFTTDEVSGARVRLRAGSANGAEEDGRDAAVDIGAETDADGFVRFEFRPPDRAGDERSAASDDAGAAGFDVLLTLPDDPDVAPVRASIVRPGPGAGFGIVSDIDDTVLVTHVRSKLDLLRLNLLETSARRVAFPVVAEFYRALVGRHNPIFYVSASPWNLYRYLDRFLRLKGLPAGPLLLRDIGPDRDALGLGAHDEHKLDAIRDVLDLHPELPFVLIGDNGENDPETYATVAGEYPGRIRAVWIRDVVEGRREAERARLDEALGGTGVDAHLVADTADAARHAERLGLIAPSETAAVAAAVARDAVPEKLVEPTHA